MSEWEVLYDVIYLRRLKGAYQKCRVDNLWVGMVKKKDKAWQAALVFYDGSSVQGVCSEVSELVHHSLCIYLRTHGASCLDGMLIKPTSSLEKKTKNRNLFPRKPSIVYQEMPKSGLKMLFLKKLKFENSGNCVF